MPADVFNLTVSGQDDDFAHLHVVVIDIDADQCLCVPAYDAEGQKITELTEALHRQAIYQGTGWIEINNAAEVQFTGKWAGKVAKWVTYKLQRIERKRLRRPIGQMSDRGLARVVECLLNLHAERPNSTLTGDELKKVKRLAKALGVPVRR